MKRDPRLEELLVKRALDGLSDAEGAELRALGGEDDESFDRAVAAVELSLPHEEALPAALSEAILAGAPGTGSGPQRLPAARTASPWPAWVAAAAGIALAVGAWGWATSRPPQLVRVIEAAPPLPSVVPAPPPTPAEERGRLLAASKDARRLDWKPTKDPAGQSASGDVVWSNTEQKGYMRFAGLQPNDAQRAQYQLWIFDRDRDAKYPVDGGVFDVPPGGEVIVAIAAKLHVDEPTLFAVTVEKPGGVVVSKRERIVLVASPPG